MFYFKKITKTCYRENSAQDFFYFKTLKICHFQDFSVNEYFIEISTFWELVERKHDRIIHKKNYIHWMMGG